MMIILFWHILIANWKRIFEIAVSALLLKADIHSKENRTKTHGFSCFCARMLGFEKCIRLSVHCH